MRISELKKHIKLDTLTPTSDNQKYMYKVYLKLKLVGNKWYNTYLYSCFNVLGAAIMVVGDKLIKQAKEEAYKALIKLFKDIKFMVKRDGYYTEESEEINYYDRNGKLIDDITTWDGKIISIEETIITKKKCYIKKPLQIKPVLRRNNK